MGMTEDQRAPGAHQIEVSVTIHILDPRALSACDEGWAAVYCGECPDRRVHTTWNVAGGFFEKRLSAGKSMCVHEARVTQRLQAPHSPRPADRASDSSLPNSVWKLVLGETAKVVTFEERVKVHSMNKACIGCHKKLDPIAFAVNDYDTIGRMIGKPNHEAKRKMTARLEKAGRTMARAVLNVVRAWSVRRGVDCARAKLRLRPFFNFGRPTPWPASEEAP